MAKMTGSTNKRQVNQLDLDKIKPDEALRQRFGQFLVAQNIVPEAAINKALNKQKNTTKSIGKLAYEHEFMTMEQVFMVLNKQKSDTRLFGEIARELGFITSMQIDLLLRKQKQSRPKLGETLVEQDALDQTTLTKQLDAFFDR